MLLLKDRVETSPEQMAACTALAESLSSSTGLFTRVVGWYHSHPHITVLPSHVDVSTQVGVQLC
jgi:BRCA1/BRCA2-containing complex subunit 3